MTKNIGQVLWTDLTVANAVDCRDFYHEVIGWSSEGVSMGDYEDFSMKATGPRPDPMGDGSVVAGVCHAKGDNGDMPAQWIIYVGVEDLDASIAKAKQLGGKHVSKIRSYGKDRFSVIADPAGAVIGLYQQAD